MYMSTIHGPPHAWLPLGGGWTHQRTQVCRRDACADAAHDNEPGGTPAASKVSYDTFVNIDLHDLKEKAKAEHGDSDWSFDFADKYDDKAIPKQETEGHVGKDHHECATTLENLENLGNAHGDFGVHTTKKEMLERTQKTEEAHFGKDHNECATTLENLRIAHSELSGPQLE